MDGKWEVVRRRALALLADAAIALMVLVVAGAIVAIFELDLPSGWWVPTTAILILFAPQVMLEGRIGKTPGKYIENVRVVVLEMSTPQVGLQFAVIRWLPRLVLVGAVASSALPNWVRVVSGIALAADHAWALVDARGRSIHDIAARTAVVSDGTVGDAGPPERWAHQMPPPVATPRD